MILKIFFVDSDPFVHKIIRSILTSNSSHVLSATTYGEALILLKDHHDIDIVFMEGELYDVDTIDLIREFRKVYFGDIVAIPCNRRLLKRMVQAGCNQTMPKPISLEDVYSRMGEKLLQRQRSK